MNIIKNKLTPIVIASALLFSATTVLANSTPALTIETGAASSSKITNLVATMQNDTLSVSGKMKRANRTHQFIPGKVKIELFDKNGDLFKTVNVSHRKHRHHVYKPYKFSSNIKLDSHEISKVVVTHK
ncbi:MAG: hypothetical protein ACC657_13060 [Thiohalomonadales bacterium]